MKNALIGLLAVLCMGGCKRGEIAKVPDDEAVEVVIEYRHLYNGELMEPDAIVTGTDGRMVRFRYVRHLLTNMALVNAAGDTMWPNIDRILVREDKVSYSLGRIRAGKGAWQLVMLYGVDSLTNTTVQPPMVPDAGDPLAPQFPSMYWTWESGYLFSRIEAMADTGRVVSGHLNGFLDFHLGKTGLSRWLGPYPLRQEEGQLKLTIAGDLHPMISALNLPEEFSCHTFENIALAERLIQAITDHIKPLE